jgi:hypothetical protein
MKNVVLLQSGAKAVAYNPEFTGEAEREVNMMNLRFEKFKSKILK